MARPRSNPAIRAALKAADARTFGATETDWQKQMTADVAGMANVASLVNYATAPVGSKKFDASSLGR